MVTPTGYSHVVTASGRTVYVSGQLPLRADGSLAGEDIHTQADQVFRNLETALAAAGATWAHVVRLGWYLVDLADLAAVREVRDRHLDGYDLPASTLVQVVGLVHPGARLEVDLVACLD